MTIKDKNIIFLFSLTFLWNYSFSQVEIANNVIPSQVFTEYSNKKFKLSASVPNDWYVYGEQQEGRKRLTIDWGLPKVFDSILNDQIENAIYIKAFRNKSIKNTNDIILGAYLRIAGSNTSLVAEPNIGYDARILYMDASNGIKYKGKVYFKYHNNIGYRITYMATSGTYEQNLDKFESFISSLKFD